MRNYIFCLMVVVVSTTCFSLDANAQGFEGYNASACHPANIISRDRFNSPIFNPGIVNGPAGDMVPGVILGVSGTTTSGWRNIGTNDVFVVCPMPDEFNKSANIQESFAFVQNGVSNTVNRRVMLVNSGTASGAIVAESFNSGSGQIGDTQINGSAILMGDGTQYKTIVYRLPREARFLSDAFAYH